MSPQQVQEIVDYLKSPGSGPDSKSSFNGYVDEKLNSLSVKLPHDLDYVFYSGKDRFGDSNYLKAKDYIEAREGRAGLIGNTTYGQHIVDLEANPAKHADFGVMEKKLAAFMDARGVQPLFGDHAGALRDVMWNAGSPRYMENAIARGRPTMGFVDGAPDGRGFAGLELPTALDHPQHRFNGQSMDQFRPDALEFARNSSFKQDALYRSLAESATVNDGKPVTVLDIHRRLAPVHGYDALNQTLFNRPVADYASFGLDEMVNARKQAMTPPHTISLALKAGGVAGVAFLAQDFAVSGHKWIELRGQGNAAGADSTAAHFVGRNVGGALGGFVAGAGVGLTTGSWTGPGALLTGIGGGALGAYLGDRWAEQKDIERIYKQEDPLGRVWERDPADPQGRWMRAADQQRVQGSDLGTGVEGRPLQTALGQDVTFQSDYVAVGNLERQLNWKAATASYGLGLTNPPAPKDPYRLSAYDEAEPRGAFEADRAFVRDPNTRQWQLEINEAVDGRAHITRTEPVSAERAQALDEQSRVVIAQNAANTPAAMAARYMVAYEQQGWSDFGDEKHPSIPTAIQHARDNADTLRASDGNTYARQDDGQWSRNGVLGATLANRNVGEELEVTWQSQKQGVEGLAEVASEAKASRQPAAEGIRGLVEGLYAQHRIERTEEQLAAATSVVAQRLNAEDRQTDVVLELMLDPRTNAYSPESAIAAYSDMGGIETFRGTITPADVAQAIAQRQSVETQAAPIQEPPEQRISALTPDQWEAHQQAMREANRQGASEEEVAQAAMAAAQQAGGHRSEPVQVAQPETELHRPQVAQVQAAAEPHREVAALAAAHAAQAVASPVAPARTEQAGSEQQPSAQERARQEDARTAERQSSPTEHEAYREPVAEQHAHHEARMRETESEQAPVSELVSDDWGRAPTHFAHVVEQRRVAQVEDPAQTAVQDHAVEQLFDRQGLIDASEVASTKSDAEPEAPRNVTEHPREQIPDVAEAQKPAEHAVENVAERGFTVPERDVSAEMKTAHAAVAQSIPATTLDPREPSHPDHRLYEQIRGHVVRLDEGLGRQYDAASERLTGSLLVTAKQNGLQRVDNVLLSEATPTLRAGQNVFLVQGESGDPAHKRAVMSTQEAVTSTFEQSMEKLDALVREDQAKAQVVTNQQQEQHDRMQQEMNPPIVMG